MAVSKRRWRRSCGGGLVAGLVGGLVLLVFLLVINLVRGGDLWLGLKIAGAPFLGERAMQPGFDGVPVVVGVVSHFGVSAVWGMLFGLVFYGLSRPATLLAGALWGFVVWLGMFYAVLPTLGLGEMAASMPIATAILEHLLFGLSVAVGFLPFQRELIRPAVPPTTRRILR